jgi:6-phosphofructokinase 2
MAHVVTLTLNPALDLSTAVDAVVPFRKLRCEALRRDPGGGGINVARVVRRLEGDAVAVYPAGGPAGEFLERLVTAEGVTSRTIAIAGDTREDFTAFETNSGKQYRFVAPGPTLSDAEWRAAVDAFAALTEKGGYCVVSGSLPPGVPESVFSDIARKTAARAASLVLDTTAEGLRAALAHDVALIKPNQQEFAELSGVDDRSTDALLAAARRLIAQGRVGAIALSLAEDGALLVTNDGAWAAQAPRVAAKSTVGAGDSFLGGMVHARLHGKSWPDALRRAVAAGSAALLSPGTDLARPDAIALLEPDVVIEALG